MHIGNPRLTRFVYCSDCSDIFKTLSISREKIPKFLQYVDFQEGDLLSLASIIFARFFEFSHTQLPFFAVFDTG